MGTKTERKVAIRARYNLLRSQKRKRALYRRFLVSLGVRRRRIPISLIGTKETRHDEELLGDSGRFFPPVCAFTSCLCSDERRQSSRSSTLSWCDCDSAEQQDDGRGPCAVVPDS